jgi:hypothetical protein
VEERAQNFSLGEGDFGCDSREALEPGSAQELHEDGFGLIVEGVGGEDVGGLILLEKRFKGLAAEVAGGFFEGLAVQSGVGLCVYRDKVQGDFEAAAEVFDERLIGSGFCAAQGVVDVDGGEADADRVSGQVVGGVQQQEQGGRVGSAGDGAASTVAGAEGGGWKSEHGCSGHRN